jgi:hypothetical protein
MEWQLKLPFAAPPLSSVGRRSGDFWTSSNSSESFSLHKNNHLIVLPVVGIIDWKAFKPLENLGYLERFNASIATGAWRDYTTSVASNVQPSSNQICIPFFSLSVPPLALLSYSADRYRSSIQVLINILVLHHMLFSCRAIFNTNAKGLF